MAEELKLKGLTGTSLIEHYTSIDDIYLANNSVKRVENQIKDNFETSEDVSIENIYNTTNEIVTVEDDKIDMVNIGIDELYEKIEEIT